MAVSGAGDSRSGVKQRSRASNVEAGLGRDNVCIGAHVSTAGGMDKAVGRALDMGACVMQTHPAAPQSWRHSEMDDAQLAQYQKVVDGSGVQFHFFHAIYLINLGTPDPEHRQKSIAALQWSLRYASRLGVDGVVFHPGSHRGEGFDTVLPRVRSAIAEVVADAPAGVRLLLENSAGQGGGLGRTLEEWAAMLEGTSPDSVGVCLDTAHLFASGWDIRDKAGADAFAAEFGKLIGWKRLAVIHANDSRAALSSNVDRHANIGEGEIGLSGFSALMGVSELRSAPWVLEVPGEGKGPDLDNVNRLRAVAGLPPVAPALSAG